MKACFIGRTRTDKAQAAALQCSRTPLGVGVQAVATVDNDVVRLKQRHELLDHCVDGGAGLDHQHHGAGAFERGHEIGQGRCALQLLAGMHRHKGLHHLGAAVVHRHPKAPALDIEHQVLAHHRQADQAQITSCRHRVSRPKGTKGYQGRSWPALARQTWYQSSASKRSESAATASAMVAMREEPVIGRGRAGCRRIQA